MDDSDEYFDESFILDEAALASIQATEERYGASLSQAQSTNLQPLRLPQYNHQPPSSTPPPKRLKTSHGWIEPFSNCGVAHVPSQPAHWRMQGKDDNPDIRVGPDGNYVIGAQSNTCKDAAGVVSLTNRQTVLPPARVFAQLEQTLDFNATDGGEKSTATIPSVTEVDRRTVQATPPAAQPVLQCSSSYHKNQNPQPVPAASPPSRPLSPQCHEFSQSFQRYTYTQKDGFVRRGSNSVIHSVYKSSTQSTSQERTRIIEQALAEASVNVQPRQDVADISASDPSDVHAEMASLRMQLNELSEANAAMQRSLREAEDAQLVKAGEVSILRQNIDKTKKEYAEAVAKAKAEMMAHEKIKAELEARLKEETERMATRFIFKQHEMETSTRKPIWGSGRSRRIAKDPSGFNSALAATPTHVRGQLSLFSTNYATGQALPTQNRPGFKVQSMGEDDEAFSSPVGGRRAVYPNQEVKQPRFKGFHNTFVDLDPVVMRSPMKGNEGNVENEGNDLFFARPAITQFGELRVRKVTDDTRKAHEATRVPELDGWACEAGGQETPGDGELLADVDDQIEEDMISDQGVDWGEELRRIVFTRVAPRTSALTLHMLFSTALPLETPSSEKHAYATACQVIIETCGAKQGRVQYPEDSEHADVVDKVATAFATMFGVLGHTGCLEPLVALVDLLTLLTLYIPAFLSPFLAPAAVEDSDGRELDHNRPSQLLSVVCDVVCDHLLPPRLGRTEEVKSPEGKEKTRLALAMAVVQLMESLCWNVKDGLVEQLGLILCRPHVLEALLDSTQAVELVERTLRLLILLASHKKMFRYLLPPSELDVVEQGRILPQKDWYRIPLVERLCHYLTRPAAEELHRSRLLVITLISLLSDSHADACSILVDSVSLAPSLVICIANLSRLLWEEDIGVMESRISAKQTMDMLYLSVNLLHRLVFAPDLSPALGRKLVEASRLPGPFNGVTHMFIVTFGRLSWAEVPIWLDDECKNTCEIVAELAVEIIEVVVAGPECDSLWTVWHQDEEIDDEEAEAQKIHID